MSMLVVKQHGYLGLRFLKPGERVPWRNCGDAPAMFFRSPKTGSAASHAESQSLQNVCPRHHAPGSDRIVPGSRNSGDVHQLFRSRRIWWKAGFYESFAVPPPGIVPKSEGSGCLKAVHVRGFLAVLLGMHAYSPMELSLCSRYSRLRSCRRRRNSVAPEDKKPWSSATVCDFNDMIA